jgi:hypothetical protein
MDIILLPYVPSWRVKHQLYTLDVLLLPEYLSRFCDSLRAGRSGDRNLAETRFYASAQTGRGAHPAFYTESTGYLPRPKPPGRGVLDPPYLVPRLKKE